MPRADRKLVDAAIRRARWDGIVVVLRKFAIPLALTLAMIGLFVFATSSPPRHVAFIGGEVVGFHHTQSKTGRVFRAGNVRLGDGREVAVMMPTNHALASRQRVTIEVLHYDRPPQRTIYRFVRYEDAQAASDAGP